MRFFKYLVLIFLSIISVNASAYFYWVGNKAATIGQTYCETSRKVWAFSDIQQEFRLSNPDTESCRWYRKDWSAGGPNIQEEKRECPASGWPVPTYFTKGDRVPIRLCKDGCSIEGNGLVVDGPNYSMTPMHYTGDSVDCTDRYSNDPPPKCDTKDPYGECYIPPNDNCVRLKDGSITCPDNQSPPIKQGCENGATYCVRPPGGCGPDYVSGTFNGQQLCVKKGDSKPPDPTDPKDPENPNACTNAYCPKPDDSKECPTGYYQTTFNGSKICVKNNPDPTKPNPNDPNTDNGGGASEPTDGGDNGGTGGSVNLKPVIDAINALKNALLSAISGITAKLDQLVNGQKDTNKKLDTSNEHLDKIEDATQAASEALGTANGHLEKIEEATKATSEAVGETNKKLDSVKDSIDSQTKCRDQSTGKYRECTSEDLKKLGDSDTKLPTSEMGKQSFSLDVFKVNAANCPADKELNLPTMFGTISKTFSFQEVCNQTAFFGYIVLILAYSFAVVIVMRA